MCACLIKKRMNKNTTNFQRTAKWGCVCSNIKSNIQLLTVNLAAGSTAVNAIQFKFLVRGHSLLSWRNRIRRGIVVALALACCGDGSIQLQHSTRRIAERSLQFGDTFAGVRRRGQIVVQCVQRGTEWSMQRLVHGDLIAHLMTARIEPERFRRRHGEEWICSGFQTKDVGFVEIDGHGWRRGCRRCAR